MTASRRLDVATAVAAVALWLRAAIVGLPRLDALVHPRALPHEDTHAWVALATFLIVPIGTIVLVRRRHGGAPDRLAARPAAVLGRDVLLLLTFAALLTPLLAEHTTSAAVHPSFLPPGPGVWFGSDETGADVFARVLYGARVSLGVGVVAVGLAVSIGGLLGGIAGYYGGWIDRGVSWVIDLLLSLPRLAVLLLVVGLSRPDAGRFLVVAGMLGFIGWMGVARIVRAQVLAVRELDFVTAARALGLPERTILVRHVLPNVAAPLVVFATLAVGDTILTESALAFLGYGASADVSWGSMVAGTGISRLRDAPWVGIFPGLAIAATVMACNLFGDGLRDSLDPRQRGQAPPPRLPSRDVLAPASAVMPAEGGGGPLAGVAVPALEIVDLHVDFDTEHGLVPAVHGVSFSVPAGGSLGLVGASGSGKSVTAMSVLRLLPENVRLRGTIRVAGVDVAGLDAAGLRALRGGRVGMVFQEPGSSLNPVFRVGAQVEEAVRLHQPLGAAAVRARVEALLAEVGLDGLGDRFPHELSGGQKQRVMIAMALANDPALLIADEPTTALDVTVQKQLLDLLARLRRDRGMALLFVSHDLDVVAEVADSAAVMREGRIVSVGPVASVPAAGGVTRAAPVSAPEASALLVVEDLHVAYPVRSGLFRRVTGTVRAVDGVSFNVRRGETFAIVGESGSGKSSLARAVLGLLPVAHGRVFVGGVPVGRPSTLPAIRRRMQAVFQDTAAALDPRWSVEATLREALDVHAVGDPSERADRVVALIREVGLAPELRRRLPHELSGGQRQRVGIARALAVAPELLVLDECVSSLDVEIQAQILDLFVGLQAGRGLTYLFISHDLRVVQRLAHHVGVMYRGSLVECGPTEGIFAAPQAEYTRGLLASVPSRARS